LQPLNPSDRDFSQSNALDRRPDDRQTTRFGREGVNLVGALPNEASETFDGIGRLNVSMHSLRELVKRQEVLFILSEAAHCFWIALALFGLKSRQLSRCGTLFLGYRHGSLLWKKMMRSFHTNDLCLYYLLTAALVPQLSAWHQEGGGEEQPEGYGTFLVNFLESFSTILA